MFIEIKKMATYKNKNIKKNPFKEWSAEETEGTYENYKINVFLLD